MRIFRWLSPGINIKRWLFTFGAGMIISCLGFMFMFNYRWIGSLEEVIFRILYEWTGHYNYTILASLGVVFIFIGIVLMAIATRKLIKMIIAALMPNASEELSDLILANMKLSKGPAVTVVGGGTGLSVMLRGLKKKTGNITAVVTVADDGGSSGRIREDLDMIAPGDLRNCLVALAEKEGLMENLFDHRFGGNGGLTGHSFGNLFIAALTEVLEGDVEKALEASSKILKVRGQVIPASTEKIRLVAEMEDGTVVEGESNIPSVHGHIRRIRTLPEHPKAVQSALDAITQADAVIIGPGSLYTSIMPNLLIPDIAQSIQESDAFKIYICNVMTQPGETDGYTVSDHVKAIMSHLQCDKCIDFVIANTGHIPEEMRKRYEKEGSYPVRVDKEELDRMGVTLISGDLINQEGNAVHDPEKLAKILMDLVYALKKDVSPGVLQYYLKRYNH